MRVGSNFGTRGSVNCRHIVGCREVGILVEGALGYPSALVVVVVVGFEEKFREAGVGL